MNCSHPLDPLFQTDRGAVFRCEHCGWFNVLFRPVVFTHSREGFEDFCALIRMLEPDPGADPQTNECCYHLHTPDRQIGLLLSQEEVDDLRELLDGAAAMDELDGLIDDALDPTGSPPG
ncbi:MAG: DUF6686 family protein [Bacteroidota bacterium]